MAEYRVYKSGEQEPVRRVRTASHGGQGPQRPRKGMRRGPARRSSDRSGWALGIVAAILLVVLFVGGWLYGRPVLSNSLAAIDLARLSGVTEKVPGWAMYATPAAVVLILALVTGYLAFGRHPAVKIIGLVTVTAVLAMPGLALGYANGTVSVVTTRTAVVEEVVKKTEEELRPALPGQAVNILLIGKDGSTEGDPGRSDTQLLVRLDPDTESISMLSIPRDLRVEIPGVGFDKMNAAYFYGGPSLVVKTFSHLTGLPIHHFVEVDFEGFRHAVNILGGIYIPVDRRYYNATDPSYKKLDIAPGYQLLKGGDALDFARFRHDERGDFNRMQRQQLLLRETQHQSGRWSEDWEQVTRLIRALTQETTSDINSLKRLKPLVELGFQVDASKVYTAHLEGATPTIDGISFVVPTPAEIASAVAEFTHPTEAPSTSGALVIRKKTYTVVMHNASGVAGLTSNAAAQLKGLGYVVRMGADAPEFPGTVTRIYAPKRLVSQANALAALIPGSKVKTVSRARGGLDGVRVFFASSFDGTLDVPVQTPAVTQTLQQRVNYDVAGWKALQSKTTVPLERPTAWSPGFVYSEFFKYSVETTAGKRSRAAVAVVRTPQAGYWSIQAMRWLSPPVIENPSSKEVVKGTEYLYFYQGSRIHMVAWKRNRTLYWVINTLNNELSNDFMRGVARSFKSVK